jgi:hypothetical protein
MRLTDVEVSETFLIPNSAEGLYCTYINETLFIDYLGKTYYAPQIYCKFLDGKKFNYYINFKNKILYIEPLIDVNNKNDLIQFQNDMMFVKDKFKGFTFIHNVV